ncbi:ECF transporter S component [Metabacillus herbersteinensis]|uniref:ECF transporter S component n=1 Tax=Metabacillus herbersteinensis TaxID=283816 RepID=A0ABV6GF63_9BACI
MIKLKNSALLAIFISLSVIGASIKVPAVAGSIALDSVPALVGAILVGPLFGAITAFFGHLFSAMLGGFLLGPLHLVIALEMLLITYVFSFVYNKGYRRAGLILFVFLNSIVAPIPFIFIISSTFYLQIFLPLLIGSIVNALITALLLPKLVKFMNKQMSGQKHA